MEIKLTQVKIRDLVKDYQDEAENGVRAFGGKLDVRPPFQREFVYKDKQREAVITTVKSGFPLNVMYWSKRDDGTFEIIDGQQRTISICQYYSGIFSHDMQYYHSLTSDQQEKFLNYELQIYVCEGTPSEKLDWFKVINIAGEKLTNQELRNAVYIGSFISDAKRYFSKNGCIAYKMANKYLTGDCIRQDYLETALGWMAGKSTDEAICEYMSIHQHDGNATDLWNYFSSVIDWTKGIFPTYRKEMKGVDWGTLYRAHGKRADLNAKELEKQVSKLMADSDVTNKKGIYFYVLDGNENCLNIRKFDENIRRSVYEKQKKICKLCKKPFEIEEMEADHITPWSKGGRTVEENCQMICQECNRHKSDK